MNDLQGNNKAKKILIIPSFTLTPSGYLALCALLQNLKEQGLEADIAVKNNNLESNSNIFPLGENSKIIKTLPEQRVMLQFPGQGNSVKNIQWNQDKDQLNLYITMSQGKFEVNQMKLKKLAAEFNKVIVIEANSLDELDDFAGEEFRYIFETKVISIGTELKGDIKDLQNFTSKEHSGIGEDMYAYLSQQDQSEKAISKETADLLLASIFLGTDHFKNDLKSGRTFEICAELISKGGSNSKAHDIALKFNK